MKTLLTFIIAFSISVVACETKAQAIDKDELVYDDMLKLSDKVVVSEYPFAYNLNFDCDKETHYQYIKNENKGHWSKVPTDCDPSCEAYKADIWGYDPILIDREDEELHQKMLESFYDRLVTKSSQNSVAN